MREKVYNKSLYKGDKIKDMNNRAAKMYVDLKAIAYNVNAIKEKLNPKTQIMAVIKASGYGSGASEIVNTLLDNGVTRLAAAITEEGIKLRKQGITVPILILTQPFDTDLEKIIEYNLIPVVSNIKLAEKLNAVSFNKNKTTRIHVEIDTGMGRTGIQPDEAEGFMTLISRLRNIEPEGIFTHFSSADSDESFTELQISRFERVLSRLKDRGIEIPLRHACNSAGIINFPKAHYDIVRPGLMLYGYYPDEALKEKICLRPSLSLKSRVIFLKTVPEGTPISYNGTFTAKRELKIATIPIGYADGYRRELSNKGFVMIKGIKAPIVGKVCMDMFMVDATDVQNAEAGDEVIIFDGCSITVDEIAKSCGTINYEIISTIGDRVPREYLK